MKKFVLGLVIIIGLVLIVAIYFDWLNIRTDKNKISIEADPSKAKADLKKGEEIVKEKGKELYDSAKEKFGKKDTAVTTSSTSPNK